MLHMLSCQLPPSTMSTSNFPAQIGRKQRFSGHRFLCFAHSLPIQLLRQLYALPEGKDMTVWPSGPKRWLQAPVRKGVGSNPTAVIGSSKAKKAGAAQASKNCNCHLCHKVQSSSTCLRGRAALLLLRTQPTLLGCALVFRLAAAASSNRRSRWRSMLPRTAGAL